MKELTTDDRLFYFERNWFTLDGLWIIEVEKATNFETALAVDLAVWERLFKIVYRRIKEYLKADTGTVAGIVDVLAFRWSCEEWEYAVEQPSPHEARVSIRKCPYNEMMKRNADRKAVIPRICKDICIPIYEAAVASLNPAVRLCRTKFMGLGDDVCSFELTLEQKH
ncbi:MAG: L-2-amino-thiazoline-4-carboxylic acid hydrolase [Candidatus Lokiarchaeota archaeon]|nr:L-2-amino-thiazoline-4-carboxylic acid hydrolase [Candidatus Lokiarchaeota archaeon]